MFIYGKKSSLLWTRNDKKLSIKIIILFGRFCCVWIFDPFDVFNNQFNFPRFIHLFKCLCLLYMSFVKIWLFFNFKSVQNNMISCFYKLLKNNYCKMTENRLKASVHYTIIVQPRLLDYGLNWYLDLGPLGNPGSNPG